MHIPHFPLPPLLHLLSLLPHLTATNALPQSAKSNDLTCSLTKFDMATKSAALIPNVKATLSSWAADARAGTSQLPYVLANHKPNSCLKPFISRGTVTLGMCVGDHGGGERGIVWEVDEIVNAVNMMIGACRRDGKARVKGMAEIGGTRGGVWIGYRDVGWS